MGRRRTGYLHVPVKPDAEGGADVIAVLPAERGKAAVETFQAG